MRKAGKRLRLGYGKIKECEKEKRRITIVTL